MNNTALRAEAQSANKKHMVFNSEEHEKFYYEKLEQARYQDCYHKVLIYILGISEKVAEHGKERMLADSPRCRISVKEKLAEMRERAYGQKMPEKPDISKGKGKEESL